MTAIFKLDLRAIRDRLTVRVPAEEKVHFVQREERQDAAADPNDRASRSNEMFYWGMAVGPWY